MRNNIITAGLCILIFAAGVVVGFSIAAMASPAGALFPNDQMEWVRPTTTTTTTTTTTSTIPPTENEQDAAEDAAPSEGGYRLESTAYCLRGTMANGEQVHAGAVASDVLPMGATVQVVETGAVYTVEDRGAPFDIWMASCDAAIQYGVQTVTVRVVG